MPGRYTSVELRQFIVKMSAEGKTSREIAQFFCVSQSTVVRILQRLHHRASLATASKPGRPKKTTAQVDRLI
jgi:transposase